MRVLVACEESGVVRDAFRRLGHDAWSNDLQPARRGGPHLQVDCRLAISAGPWDIIIFHPPCTALSVSGNRTYGAGKPRYSERQASLAWTLETWRLVKAAARVGAAMENPASILWLHVAEPVQWVQPFMFGHRETKKTGFALDRLPRLKATQDVQLEMHCLPNSVKHRVHFMSPSQNRARDRSETYAGIAAAMAEQWGSFNSSILAA